MKMCIYVRVELKSFKERRVATFKKNLVSCKFTRHGSTSWVGKGSAYSHVYSHGSPLFIGGAVRVRSEAC